MSSLQHLSAPVFDAELLMQLPAPIPAILKEVGPDDYDLVTMSVLTCVSAVLPNVHTYYHKAMLRPNLFSLIVSRAANMKSRARIGRACLTLIEQQLALESQEEAVRQKVLISSMTSPESFCSSLDANKGRGLVFSTEADTLTSTLGKEYGKGLSEMLRQAYAHEEISQDFRSSGSVHISDPAVSVLLTGTQGQLSTLINDVENGLLSRFAYYVMSGVLQWRPPFTEGGNTDSLRKVEEDASKRVFLVWRILRKRKRSLLFRFDSLDRFGDDGYWASQIESQDKDDAELALSIRAAEREARISMALEALRIGEDLSTVGDEVEVHPETSEQAAHLSEVLLDHSRIALQMIRGVDKEEAISNCKAQGLSIRATAKTLGLSRSAVHRAYQKMEE